jgi:hypothetical protein
MEVRRRDLAGQEKRCGRLTPGAPFCHIMTAMKPEEIMRQPADAILWTAVDDVLWNPEESPVTGETDAAEDDEEMTRDGLPPARFVH